MTQEKEQYAAHTGGAAEIVNDHDKVQLQFPRMPSLKCMLRLSSHICQYEDKRSVLPRVAPHHRSTLEA